jgi:hypothetical protein
MMQHFTKHVAITITNAKEKVMALRIQPSCSILYLAKVLLLAVN